MKDSFSEKRSTTQCKNVLIDPNHTAVLVVDMLNDFFKPGGTMVLEGGGEILYKPIEALMKLARLHQIPIFWLNQCMQSNDKLFEKHAIHCIKRTWGSCIVDELTYDSAKDIIIEKTRYSGFFETSLNQQLQRRHGITHLIIVGVVTNICIRSTIHDAFFLGYDVIVPKDCVMATSNQQQDCHLYDIDTHYGTVIESYKDILTMLIQKGELHHTDEGIGSVTTTATTTTETIHADGVESEANARSDVKTGDGTAPSQQQSQPTSANNDTSTTNHKRNNESRIKKEKKKKKRIGIICGSGPDAGIDMFSKILQIHRERFGDGNYQTDKDAPNIMISQVSSIGGPRNVNDLIRGTTDCQQTWDNLKHAIVELVPLVDCFCICCNQLHFFENDIQNLLINEMGLSSSSDNKFVSFINVTIDHLLLLDDNNNNIDGSGIIAILGGPITTELFVDMKRSPYIQLADALPSSTSKLLQLTETERNRLLDIIKAVKQTGGVTTETKSQFESLLNELQTNYKVGIAILACTELPLLVVDDDDDNPPSKTSLSCPNNDTASTNPHNLKHKHTIQLIDPTELVAIELLNRTQQY